MAKIYFVRHQAHGIVHEFPFAEAPTQNQVEVVARFCFQSHGFGHAKTPDQPYWTRVVEVDVLGPGELPAVPERVLAPAGEQGVARVAAGGAVISGSGTITPKGG
jgi:hypothetical protein